MDSIIHNIAKKANVKNFSSYEIFQRHLMSGGSDFCKPIDEFCIVFYENDKAVGKINCSSELLNILSVH